jgi:hypothetical protein
MPSEIASSFALLTPHAWSEVASMTPASRVKRFFLPSCDDLAVTAAAHAELVPFIAGDVLLPDAEARFEEATGGPHPGFPIAAQFYKTLFTTAECLLGHLDPATQTKRPNVQYMSEGCCPRCDAMEGVVMPWGSDILRLLCPPWHLTCECLVEDSTDEPSPACPELLAVDLEGDDQHFCTPIDLLATLRLLPEG